MIKNTDHCALCDLSEAHLKLGLICSLTNNLPIFHKSCSPIILSNRLQEKLFELDRQTEELSLIKFQVLRNLFLYPLFGIGILIGDYFFYLKYIKPYGILNTEMGMYYSPSAFLIFTILLISGLGFFGKAIGPFLHYKEDKRANELEIEKVYKVLQLYPVKNTFNTHQYLK
ncbi:hypothetical protein [Tenacibaculum agarivorans]|uniref:hypothetical protein n=1 Tax=Tenacibaculum agarivorans TaxID=1908389 RepID=UPI00094B792D|nr:hypothetical protein [Tenacibaculum agarivorans]